MANRFMTLQAAVERTGESQGASLKRANTKWEAHDAGQAAASSALCAGNLTWTWRNSRELGVEELNKYSQEAEDDHEELRGSTWN
eukprot:976621-Pelagomonas_calceolata.AAC.3